MKKDKSIIDQPSRNKPVCLIVLAISIFLLIFTYFFYIPSLPQKIAHNYTYLNPGIILTKKENLIVNFQPLRNSLIQKYEKQKDYLISVYFEYLPTGANISINKDEKMWPASLIKVPVAMAAMKKVEKGEWKLTNELVILDEDKDSEYGKLYLKPSGTTMSIDDILKESLINSDNTAHFMLLRNIESSDLENVYEHLGLDDIINSLKKNPEQEAEDNRMTAKTYSVFFRSLYNSTYFNPKYSELFLNILENGPKEYLSLGLPSNIKFVHKTGIRTDEKVYADSGIVYIPERPYIITVMIQKNNETTVETEREDVKKLFEEISKEIYNYVYEIK